MYSRASEARGQMREQITERSLACPSRRGVPVQGLELHQRTSERPCRPKIVPTPAEPVLTSCTSHVNASARDSIVRHVASNLRHERAYVQVKGEWVEVAGVEPASPELLMGLLRAQPMGSLVRPQVIGTL